MPGVVKVVWEQSSCLKIGILLKLRFLYLKLNNYMF